MVPYHDVLYGIKGGHTARAHHIRVLHDSTFSRTVWRLYGGAKGLMMWYYTHHILPRAAEHRADLVELLLLVVTAHEQPWAARSFSRAPPV